MTTLASVAIIVCGKECLEDWLVAGRVTRAIHTESHSGYGYESVSSLSSSAHTWPFMLMFLRNLRFRHHAHVPSLGCLHNVQSLLSTALSI